MAEHVAIYTDFGTFFPDAFVQKKLLSVRMTKSGRPDRRFRVARAVARYERAVNNFCKKQWLAGERAPYHSGVGTLVARAKLRGLIPT